MACYRESFTFTYGDVGCNYYFSLCCIVSYHAVWYCLILALCLCGQRESLRLCRGSWWVRC
jgi:hypothetical protein